MAHLEIAQNRLKMDQKLFENLRNLSIDPWIGYGLVELLLAEIEKS